MKKKQYIAPCMSIKYIKPVQTILFVSGSSDDNDYAGDGLDPTSQSSPAPKRLGKIYI